MVRGQVWIETVVYTLIGLALIGLVLALVTPKINEYRDKSLIEQTIVSLNVIDGKINEVLQSPGNTRTVVLALKRGTLYVNASSDEIYFVLEESRSLYSESGVPVPYGKIIILSEEGKKTHTVRLTLPYTINLTLADGGEVKKFSAAPTPYRFSFRNEGFSPQRVQIVSVSELSGA